MNKIEMRESRRFNGLTITDCRIDGDYLILSATSPLPGNHGMTAEAAAMCEQLTQVRIHAETIGRILALIGVSPLGFAEEEER